MAETFDAAARLADGGPAVADFQQYAQACQCLGYQHPDLTAHPAQVRDWYANEDGMDLRALDADCGALQAAAAAADDALARQQTQLSALATAWQGAGAHAAHEFLRRHGEAAAAAAVAVRAAANAYSDLRDRLWRAVDGKVATVLEVGDGVQARRADWLAASHTVTTGAGDRAVASELVDHEVKPFVDNVIGGQWLAAMRAAVDAVEAAYEAATEELASEPEPKFEVPGDIGPESTPPAADNPTTALAGTASAPASAPAPAASPAPAGPVPVAPAAWSAPAPTTLPSTTAAPAPYVGAAPADPMMAQPAASPSLPSLGGSLPGMGGGGLSSFGQQLGDMLGGLLGEGSLEDPRGADDALDVEEPDVEGEDESEEESEEDEPDEPSEEDTENVDEDMEPVDPAAATDCPPESEAAAPEAPPGEPAATPAPPPAEPLTVAPAPEPLPSDAGTPCQIAADELPQVGE